MCSQLPNIVLQFNQLPRIVNSSAAGEKHPSPCWHTTYLQTDFQTSLHICNLQPATKKLQFLQQVKNNLFVLVCEKHNWGQNGVQNFLSHIRMWQNDNAEIWLKSHLGVPWRMRKMVQLFRSCVAVWSNVSKIYAGLWDSHLDFVLQWELELWFPTRMQISFPYCAVGYFLNEWRFSINGHTKHGQAMPMWGVLFCK